MRRNHFRPMAVGSGGASEAQHSATGPDVVWSGTLTRFRHAGWTGESDEFAFRNTAWGGLMFRLQSAVEGKSPRPLFRVADVAC